MGLINARGGSKRISRKNLMTLCDKPILHYAIKAGKESKLIDRVVISTEDDEIAEEGKKCGAEVPFKRPKKFAEDQTTQFPPTKHAVMELIKEGWTPDIVVLLMANGPFKNGDDVDKAINTLINSNADSVRSVCEVSTPPFWMHTIDKDNSLVPFVKNYDMENKRTCISQNLPKIYQLTGIIDVLWTKNLFDTNSLFGKKINAQIFSKIKSIDIDTPYDMMVAEFVMENFEKLS